MSFIQDVKLRAKQQLKNIVLPEGSDLRTLKAASIVQKEGYANLTIIGNESKIQEIAKANNLDISKTKIINPIESPKYNEYVKAFYELRKKKGITLEQAKNILEDEVYFGMMMVKQGDADGLVSGACHSTSDTLRPALQILKTKPGTKLVSAFFVMDVPNCEYGENGRQRTKRIPRCRFAFRNCNIICQKF